MRRWIRSAISSVDHRSVRQLPLDSLLVAVAYLPAFQLRLDGAAPPTYTHLLDATLWWVIVGAVTALAAFGVYQAPRASLRRRDYEAIVKAVVAATVVVVLLVATLHPVTHTHVFNHIHGPSTPVTLAFGLIGLFLTLQLALLIGARLVQLTVVGLRRTA